MPKPEPTLTPPTPWFNLAVFKRLDPILRVVLGVITLIGALYGFVRVVVDLVEALQPPLLNLYMSDVVWPVTEPDNKEDFAINIQFLVYNPGSRMVALRRLEAELIRPNRIATNPEEKFEKFPLEWDRLIKGGPSGFESAEPVVIKPIPAHESEVLGAQLRGRCDRRDLSRTGSFDWFAGDYILRLYGFLNANDTPMELSPRSGFKFKLTKELSEELSPTDRSLTEPLSRPARLVNSSGYQRK